MSSKASLPPAPTLPSLRNLVGTSLRIFQKHFFTFLGYSGWLLVPLVLSILLRVTFGSGDIVDTVDLGVQVVTVVISVWMYAHIVMTTQHVIVDGKIPETPHSSRGVLLAIFLSCVLYGVATFLGLALIIPGILFAIWFAFAPIIVTLEKRRVFVAFAQSRELVRGRFFAMLLRLWGFDACILLLYILAVVCIDLLLGYDLAHLDPMAPLPVPMDLLLRVVEIVIMPLILVYRTVLYLAAKKA